MPLESIHREIIRIGKLLNYWQAELFASAWLALFLGLLWLGGFSDLFLKWGTGGRIVFWLLTVAAFVSGVWHVWKALSTRRTEEAVAARIEQVFPQLDNRLINVVQFEAAGALDPIRGAYLRQGVPNWSEVHPIEMREREKHKRAYIALGIAAALLLAPFFWTSATWGNALERILNPFSSRAPITVAHILSVSPGDGTCVTGNSLAISLTAAGRRGQGVSIDIWPADDKSYSVNLGELAGGVPQDFSYMVPKVDADLDYRVPGRRRLLGTGSISDRPRRFRTPTSTSRLRRQRASTLRSSASMGLPIKLWCRSAAGLPLSSPAIAPWRTASCPRPARRSLS